MEQDSVSIGCDMAQEGENLTAWQVLQRRMHVRAVNPILCPRSDLPSPSKAIRQQLKEAANRNPNGRAYHAGTGRYGFSMGTVKDANDMDKLYDGDKQEMRNIVVERQQVYEAMRDMALFGSGSIIMSSPHRPSMADMFYEIGGQEET